jgi:hypothetical protein
MAATQSVPELEHFVRIPQNGVNPCTPCVSCHICHTLENVGESLEWRQEEMAKKAAQTSFEYEVLTNRGVLLPSPVFGSLSASLLPDGFFPST